MTIQFDNVCVCCGKAVPEGRMICPDCEARPMKQNILLNIDDVMKVLRNTDLIYYCADDALDLIKNELEGIAYGYCEKV